MKKHVITRNNVDFRTEIRIAGSNNFPENKSISMVINPVDNGIIFIVKNNNVEVSCRCNIDDAIIDYNEV